jgi:hypothetical protein
MAVMVLQCQCPFDQEAARFAQRFSVCPQGHAQSVLEVTAVDGCAV